MRQHIGEPSEYVALDGEAQRRYMAALYLYARCCEPGREEAIRQLNVMNELHGIDLPVWPIPGQNTDFHSPYQRKRRAIVSLRQVVFDALGESGDDRLLDVAFRFLNEADQPTQKIVLEYYLTPLIRKSTNALQKVRYEVADPSSPLHNDPRLVRFIHGVEQEQ